MPSTRILSNLYLYRGGNRNSKQQQQKQQQEKHQQQGDGVDGVDVNEPCPVCWNDIKDEVHTLPCGHEFCKGCIQDVKKHAQTRCIIASCPVCRGPIQHDTSESLWEEALENEKVAKNLTTIANLSRYDDNDNTTTAAAATTSLSYLEEEAALEYDLCAVKLERCLNLLIIDEMKSQKKDNEFKIKIILKLQDILKFTAFPQLQSDRRIELLEEALELSKNTPLPEAHLELGKLLKFKTTIPNGVEQALGHFEAVLNIAKLSKRKLKMMMRMGFVVVGGGIKNNSKKRREAVTTAKRMRGEAHFGLGVCYQLNADYKRAAKEYDLADKYDSCSDFALAAKCHSLTGNLSKAIEYGKRAIDDESYSPLCDTYLIMLRIYEKLFTEQQQQQQQQKQQGNTTTTTTTTTNTNNNSTYPSSSSSLQQQQHQQECDHYLECLLTAKDLNKKDHEQEEFELLVLSARGLLLPWKKEFFSSHFPQGWNITSDDDDDDDYDDDDDDDDIPSSGSSIVDGGDDDDDDDDDYIHDDDTSSDDYNDDDEEEESLSYLSQESSSVVGEVKEKDDYEEEEDGEDSVEEQDDEEEESHHHHCSKSGLNDNVVVDDDDDGEYYPSEMASLSEDEYSMGESSDDDSLLEEDGIDYCY